jgi:hypothetical protein
VQNWADQCQAGDEQGQAWAEKCQYGADQCKSRADQCQAGNSLLRTLFSHPIPSNLLTSMFKKVSKQLKLLSIKNTDLYFVNRL